MTYEVVFINNVKHGATIHVHPLYWLTYYIAPIYFLLEAGPTAVGVGGPFSLVYICIRMFVNFSRFLLPTFLFLRALFGKTLPTRTHETRPETAVEVSAPSVHSGARGGRSNVFPLWSG